MTANACRILYHTFLRFAKYLSQLTKTFAWLYGMFDDNGIMYDIWSHWIYVLKTGRDLHNVGLLIS